MNASNCRKVLAFYCISVYKSLHCNELTNFIMKRTMIILAILMTAVSLAAQETGTYRDNAPKFYATTDFSVSGADFQGWGKPDFGIVGLGVYPGWRFAGNWSVFLPVSCDFILLNRQSTRNYVEQGTIGLGASYQLKMKHRQALEFKLNGGSTYLKSDINYFKAKASVNFGFYDIGASPYVGIGCSYFKPYNDGKNDKVMFEISIGMQLF